MKDATIRHSRTVWTCNTTPRLRHGKTAGRRPPPGNDRTRGRPCRPGWVRAQGVHHRREGVQRNAPPSASRGRQGHARERGTLDCSALQRDVPHHVNGDIAKPQAGLDGTVARATGPAGGGGTTDATIRGSRTAGTRTTTMRPPKQQTAERRPPPRNQRNCRCTGWPGRGWTCDPVSRPGRG